MPACPRARPARGRGGEHPAERRSAGELTLRCHLPRRVWALLRVSVAGTLARGWDAAQCWDTAQHCLPRCPWWGETHRWHPRPRRWMRPTWSSSILLPRGFPWERGCCSHSCRAFPSPWATGIGAHCFSESITHRNACPSCRKHVPATHSEGGGPAPKGAQALRAGVSSSDGFPPQSMLPEGASSYLSQRDFGFGPFIKPGFLWP